MSIDDGSTRARYPWVARVAAIGFIVATVGLLAWTAIGSDSEADSADVSGTGPSGDEIANSIELPPDLGPMPELVDISGWLNTDATNFDEVRSEVTIVQFWTFGCSNCKATLPHLQELYTKRHDEGLEIIGVHAHEFDHEREPDNVAEAVDDLGVVWPVALDTNKTSFVQWQGSPRYWPRTYVIDSENRIRFDHIGEGAYNELEATVEYLLAEQA